MNTGFDERIAALKRQIDNEIHKGFLNRKQISLYQPMAHLLNAGGKRIRPLLLILSCQAAGGKVKDCLHAAVAIELLHTFTLVHDDIMDHDDTRRGYPTVHKKWDEPTAILAGDGLVTLAYQTILKSKHPDLISILQKFTDGLLVLCEGQALDKEFENRMDVSLNDYQEMIEKKTAKLIEVACEIGTMLGNGTKEEKERLKKFAGFLGEAFQIQDDLLDILSEEKVTGKPLGSDLMGKKKTYLTIHFLTHAPKKKQEQFQTLWKRKNMQRKDVLCVRELFKNTGTFQSALQVINQLIANALKALEPLKPTRAKEDLQTLTLKIRERIY